MSSEELIIDEQAAAALVAGDLVPAGEAVGEAGLLGGVAGLHLVGEEFDSLAVVEIDEDPVAEPVIAIEGIKRLHNAHWPRPAEAITHTRFGGEDEKEENKARDKAVLTIIRRYGEDPRVKREELRYRNTSIVGMSTEDSLSMYLREAGQYDLLKAEDEQAVFARIEKGLAVYQDLSSLEKATSEQEAALIDLTSAYKIVSNSNLRLVIFTAKGMRNSYKLPFPDMIQYGNIGLATAIRRFDVTRGNKFSTFATNWIRQQITRGSLDNQRTIRTPIHIYEKWSKVRQTAKRLEVEYQREPSDEEVANAHGISREDMHDLRQACEGGMVSLNQPVGEEGATELGDMIADPEATDIDSEELQEHKGIESTFETAGLNSREVAVLSLRYGVYAPAYDRQKVKVKERQRTYSVLMRQKGDAHGMTLEQVGAVFDISRERARQIENDALKKLRGLLTVPVPSDT